MNVTSELDRLHVFSCIFVFLLFLKIFKVILKFAIYCCVPHANTGLYKLSLKNIVMHLDCF